MFGKTGKVKDRFDVWVSVTSSMQKNEEYIQIPQMFNLTPFFELIMIGQSCSLSMFFRIWSEQKSYISFEHFHLIMCYPPMCGMM